MLEQTRKMLIKKVPQANISLQTENKYSEGKEGGRAKEVWKSDPGTECRSSRIAGYTQLCGDRMGIESRTQLGKLEPKDWSGW